jgi:hypothetical protein
MTTKAVYTWRPRTEFNIDAQVAGEELARIKGHNSGDLTPDMVVKAAEDAKSPLHSVFEWDDAKAAQQQRMSTAKLLIRSVVVTVAPANTNTAESVNVSVSSAANAGGAGPARVVTEAELHQQRVQRGWEGLDQWVKTYGNLPEFTQVAGVLGVLVSQRPAKAA